MKTEEIVLDPQLKTMWTVASSSMSMIRYGTLHLKRAIEKHLVLPLANIIATKQIPDNSYVRPIKVDVESEETRRFTHSVLNFKMDIEEPERKKSKAMATEATD